MTQQASVEVPISGRTISGRTISGGVLSQGSLSLPDSGRSDGDGRERPVRDGKPA